MEAFERLRGSLQIQTAVEIARARVRPRWTLTLMTLCGFVLCGIVEHSVHVLALRQPGMVLAIQGEITAIGRRYCDPPNTTAIVVYYDSSEEIDDSDYDFSQLQEMDFQVELTDKQRMELWLKKAYLWGSIFSPFAGSQLAGKLGPKRILGYGLLGAGAATLFVPAGWFTWAHLIIRFLQGAFIGVVLPCAHMLAVNWFPSSHRSGFISWYSGIYLGYGLCELFTSQVADSLGRNAVFFLTSLLIIIWFVIWQVMVFRTPEKHPRIRRRTNIRTGYVETTVLPIPWRSLATSRPVWMSAGVIIGTQWGQTAVNITLVKYLKFVYYINITNNALLAAGPYLLHFICALVFGYLVDYIRRINLVSTTTSRKIFVYLSHFLPAGLLFVVGFVTCAPVAPVYMYYFAVVLSSACYAGAYCSVIDIAPNFVGTIFGVCLTFSGLGNLLVCYLTKEILNGNVRGSWRMVFSISSLIMLASAILFMLRGSGRAQLWNSITANRREAIQEMHEGSQSRKLNVENRILKALLVQEPEQFIRQRAYSTNSPVRPGNADDMLPLYTIRKRASIS